MSALALFSTAETTPAPEMAIALQLQKANSQMLERMVDDFRLVFARLWHNPNATPQAILDEFDTNGEAELAMIQARLDFITALAIANGQALTDYLTTEETTAPAYTTSAGVVTVT